MTRPVSIDLAPARSLHRLLPAAAIRRRALGGLLLCASGFACGCDDPAPTQLVVLIHSDFDVPSELSEVRASVRGPGDRNDSHRFPLASADSLPLSFGIVPLGGDASRTVSVEIEGRDAAGATLVTRRAQTGFVAGKRLLLPMHLARSCRGASCRDQETCTERGCLPARVPARELAPIVAGSELALTPPVFATATPDGGAADGDAGPSIAPADAAPPDAGGTPPRDAAPADAAPGRDAGSPDASSEIARIACEQASCVCEAGRSCELTCSAPMCAPLCDASRCDVAAVGQFQLDATCSAGAECTVDARGSMNGRVACSGGSRCDVDCANSTGCRLSCDGADTRCLLDCQGASGCRISSCPPTAQDCGDGVHACGRDCP